MIDNILKLKMIRLLFWMHFFAAVLVPFYSGWAGLTLSQIMLLNSWFMLCNFLLEVPTGTIADFFGRKISLILGSIFALIAAIVYVSKPSFYIFLLAEFLFAIAYTLHSGADESLAYDTLITTGKTAESKKVLSGLEAFKLTGITLGALLGGFIGKYFGVTKPMLFYIIPAGFSLITALFLKEPASPAKRESKQKYLAILKEGTLYFLKHKIILTLTIEMAFSNALIFGIIWLYQPVLIRSNVPIQYFGVIHACAAGGQILFLSNITRLEKMVPSKRLFLVLTTILSGLGFIILGLSENILLIIPAILITFTFGLPRLPVFNSYIHKFVASEQRATILSFTSMVRTIFIVVANPIIGFFADLSLTWTLFSLGILLIAIAFLSRIEENFLTD
jgi:MFS family permease